MLDFQPTTTPHLNKRDSKCLLRDESHDFTVTATDRGTACGKHRRDAEDRAARFGALPALAAESCAFISKGLCENARLFRNTNRPQLRWLQPKISTTTLISGLR